MMTFPTLVIRKCQGCSAVTGLVGVSSAEIARAEDELRHERRCTDCGAAPGTGTITKRPAAPSEVECRICGNFAYLKDRVCPRCAEFLAIPGIKEWIEEVTECSFRRGQENIQEALNS